jgi:hypothetical protein
MHLAADAPLVVLPEHRYAVRLDPGKVGFEHDIGCCADQRVVHLPGGEDSSNLLAESFSGDVFHCPSRP